MGLAETCVWIVISIIAFVICLVIGLCSGKGDREIGSLVSFMEQRVPNIRKVDEIGEEKIFIIGPVSREKEIQIVAEYYRSLNHDVDHVRKQPDKDFTTLVYEAFQKISEADYIVAVQKEEGGLGEGTTYEVAFARFIGKKVYIFQN